MSEHLQGCRADAKDPVHPAASPRQLAFFAAVEDAAAQLVRQGAYVASHRRGIPEAVAAGFLLDVLRTAPRYVALARAQGRPLTVDYLDGLRTPILVVGEVPAKVIELAPYLARKGGRHV